MLVATVRLLAKNQRAVPVFLRYMEERSIHISPAVHHEVVSGMLRAHSDKETVIHPERYLRTLEEKGTPAMPSTYAIVLRAILKMRQVRQGKGARERAWNLFAHARLVAHPKPSTEMFDVMIQACSLEDRVSPERALDLFTEMVELEVKPSYDTYRGLIRACSRAKDGVFYFEALRLLRELLDRGFQPERDIFNALLEGARPRGDLARAKWIVGNMIDLSSKGAHQLAPDDATISNLFLTFATVKPAIQQIKNVSKGYQGEIVVSEENDITIDLSEKTRKTIETLDEQSSTPKTSEFMETAIPRNKGHLVSQVKTIMKAIISARGHNPAILSKFEVSEKTQLSSVIDNEGSPSSSASTISDVPVHSPLLSGPIAQSLAAIPLSSILMNSYLTVLCSHSSTFSAYEFFSRAFTVLNVPYSFQSWEIMFDRLDKPGGHREWKVAETRKLFQSWWLWMEEKRGEPWWRRHVEIVYSRIISIEAR